MNCIHCKQINTKRWFYCRTCGKKASESKFTTNLYMGTERGKRSDVEFSTIDMDTHTNSMVKERQEESNKFWKEKVNAVR